MVQTLSQLQAAAAGGDARAQLHLGVALARAGDAAQAARWYARAAAAGLVEGQRELGLLRLFGLGVPADPTAAAELLASAEAAGDVDAAYWLALRALQTGSDDPEATVMPRLRNAARAGHPRALRSLGLVAASHGRHDVAAALLERARAAGDAHSALMLAALPPHAPLASDQVPDLDTLPAPVETDHVHDVHHTEPYVATCDAVLAPWDCRHLIELGRQRLQPSMVVHPVDGSLLRESYRSSSSTELPAFQEDPWAVWLQMRLCRLLQSGVERAEPLSLLRYEPGQQYGPHRDYLPPSTLRSPQGQRAGQRAYTVFAYLSDVEAGGGTDFPDLGVTVQPRQGRVVLFHNIDGQGQPDARTLHAGLPVEAGEKWLGTLWIRERAIRD